MKFPQYHWLNSRNRWKDSVLVSLGIITGIQTIIDAFSLNELWQWTEITWWIRILIILSVFFLLLVATFCMKYHCAKRGIKKVVNDNILIIKQQDLFSTKGLKLIPFNEFYDTKVDDIVIAHNSLNGCFIDNHVKDLDHLENIISSASETSDTLKSHIKNNRPCFPLGKIIKYNNEYLLLAFTHFVNNTALLSHNDFEKCLLNMWKEIDRVYANMPIAIPLLGSGITRFTDAPHKDNASLFACLLCTLKISGVHIKQPITLCLSEEAFNELNIYELK